MEKEIWKDIPDYEGLYQASNFGRIKSIERMTTSEKIKNHLIKSRILKQVKCGKYLTVSLSKKGKLKHYYVHRIVACSFLKNKYNYSDINHKDGNTHNNNLENLEWCTRSYNIKHSYRVLKRKPATDKINKMKSKKVNQYTMSGVYIKTFNSIKEAEEELGIKSSGKISSCCNNRYGRKSAFGYKWKFADIQNRD